jgi:hypothetical protein
MKKNRCSIGISFIGGKSLLLLRLKEKLPSSTLPNAIRILILPVSFTNYSYGHSLNNCGTADSLS